METAPMPPLPTATAPLMLISMIVHLVGFILWIMVLVKQFQEGGPLHGVLGIVTCGLWTLIWGWIHSSELGITNLMLIWTVIIVCQMVLGGVVQASAMQEMMQQLPATP